MCLEDRESKGTASDSDNVVADAVDDKLPVSGQAGNGLRDEGDVGEHAVVGGAARVDLHHVKSIGVKVDSRLGSRDALGVVEGLHVGEVLGRKGSKTSGVLVKEGDGVDRGGPVEVSGGLASEVPDVVPGEDVSTSTLGETSTGGVGSGVPGGVAKAEHKGLDTVGEPDVVLGGSTNREGGNGGGLHLLNGNVAGGLSHEGTLVVGDNGVVGPDARLEEGDGGRGGVGDTTGGGKLDKGEGVEGSKELGGSAHGEVDAHVVVRKGRGGEGNSGLPGEEERKRKHELVGHTGVKTVEEDGILSVGGGGLNTGTDHGIITSLLGGRDREGGPEVELGGLDLHGDKVVEGDGDLLDKVVHEVLDPEVLVVGGGRDNRGGDLQPSLEKVISSPGDGDRPGVSEVSGSGSRGEDNRDLGEPGGLHVLADEVGDGILTTVKVGLEGVKSGKIDESRCDVRGVRGHCFIIVKKFFLNNNIFGFKRQESKSKNVVD